jgi:hypothetical protein
MEQQEEEVVSLFDNGELEAPKEEPKAIEEDVVAEAENSFKIPEKFKGKTIEEVAESYVNLEKEYGNKANEVGELRKLTDQILQQQVSPKADELEDDINDEVGFDDLIEDPAKAVERVVSKNPRLRRLEENLMQQEANAAREVVTSRHPDVDDVVASADFQSWVSETPGRLRTFQTAHQELDAGLAADLIDMYKATRMIATEEAVKERQAKADADLKNARVETGGNPGSTKKIYKRAELIRLKQTDPERYRRMYPEIHQAYAEKRVR